MRVAPGKVGGNNMGFPDVLTLIPSTHWLEVVCSSAIAESLETPIACLFGSVLLPRFHRRQINQAIAQSEQLFAAFMDNLPGFVWMKDLYGRYVYVNQRVKRLAPQQNGWLGKTDAEIWPGAIAATFRENDLKVVASREVQETLEPCHLEGQDLWILVTRFPVFDDTGAVVMVGGAGVDITERKRAEKALRETEEKYRSIFENAVEGIFQTTPDGRFVAANPALARMLGFDSPEELMNMRTDIAHEHYVDPKSREEFKRLLEENGFVLDFELEAYRKGGSKIWVSENVRTVRDHTGTVVYYEGTTQDITGRRHAEEALRESEERYRDLVENSCDLICTHDLNGLILSANRAALELLGHTAGGFAGETNLRQILSPEVRDQFDDYLARIRADGVASGLMLVQTSTGEKRIWEYHNTLRTEDVSAPIVRGMARDITERKLAEEALRQAERKYRDIFENAVEGIFQIRPGGGYISANPALARMLGFNSSEELISERTDPSNQTFVDLGRRQEYTRLLLEEGFVRDFEYEDYRKDGSRIWLSDNAHAVRDREGILLYYEGTTQDITARKLVEQALRQSEERYRALFENAKDVTYVHDLSGKYTSVNRAAEKLTGYRLSEILGKSFINFVPPEQIENIRSQLCRKLVEEGETSYESEVITKDGRRLAVEVNSHLIFENGAAVAVQGTARDITERKAAEAKLKATSEQLRALSARLQSAREEEGTRIAREIHDELGSVLTSLKWDLEGIDRHFSTPIGPTELAALREKLHALMARTDLAISAIRRIASELRPSVLDDLGLVAAIEWQAQQFQLRTGIVCYCDCSLEKVELTEAQSTAVFRILQEALTNVLRHAQATRVDIKISKENDVLVLSVSDNGKGIPESETSDQQSLGILGMRERAHLIAGEIDIKGVEGKGTVVIVRVPISGQARVVKMTR
jgi:PAS domain S-box-containing protein